MAAFRTALGLGVTTLETDLAVTFGGNKPAQALPYLEKAVAIQPKLTQNRLNLAGCLIEVKQLARAEALLKEILEDYPKFPLAKFNLGLLYDEQGRLKKRPDSPPSVMNGPVHVFDGRVTLYHYNEIFPSLQTFSDFYYTMDNGFRLRILGSLASGFQVTTRYNNRPPAGTSDTDNLYLLTLGYAFDTTRKR